MAEGYTNALYNWPTMKWATMDLSKVGKILSTLRICFLRTTQQVHGKRENIQPDDRFTSLSSGTLFKLDQGKTDMTSVKGTYLNESPKNSRDTSKPKRTQ